MKREAAVPSPVQRQEGLSRLQDYPAQQSIGGLDSLIAAMDVEDDEPVRRQDVDRAVTTNLPEHLREQLGCSKRMARGVGLVGLKVAGERRGQNNRIACPRIEPFLDTVPVHECRALDEEDTRFSYPVPLSEVEVPRAHHHGAQEYAEDEPQHARLRDRPMLSE